MRVPIYDDLDDRDLGPDLVERCRRDFEATGNPLYAWEAWSAIRATWRSRLHERLEVPPWLYGYLDECARRLIGTEEKVEGSRKEHDLGEGISLSTVQVRVSQHAKPREGAGSIGLALGFVDGLAKSRKRWGGRYDETERLALQVVERMFYEGWTLYRAANVMEKEKRGEPIEAYIDAFAESVSEKPGLPLEWHRNAVGAAMKRAGKGAAPIEFYPPRILESAGTMRRAVYGARRFALRAMQDRLRAEYDAVPEQSKVASAYSKMCGNRGRAMRKSVKKRAR